MTGHRAAILFNYELPFIATLSNYSPPGKDCRGRQKNSYHFKNPSCKGTICRVLPHFAQGSARAHSAKKSGKNPEMRQIEANRGRHS